MARKRTLSTLDTSISYEAVGLDLAKRNLNRSRLPMTFLVESFYE